MAFAKCQVSKFQWPGNFRRPTSNNADVAAAEVAVVEDAHASAGVKATKPQSNFTTVNGNSI
jgi:hypothetical protein